MTFRVLSFEFDVSSSVRGVERRLSSLLEPFTVPNGDRPHHAFAVGAGDGPPPALEVRLDGDVVHRTTSPEKAIDFILWKASTRALAALDGVLAIHAGAVSWRDQGVVLPAPHDSGKTTLSAGLTRVGFSYLSDEAALVDPETGWLVPFPRALWLEEGSVEPVSRLRPAPLRSDGTTHVSAEQLRGGSIGAGCPARFVIFPSYVARGTTELEPLGRAEAVVELAKNCMNLDRFGADGVRLLADLVRGSDCYRLRVGDLGEAVDAICGVVGKPR